MSHVSDFMVSLGKRLVDEKKVTESSANAYIRNLYVMNDKKPFKNLAFLRNVDEIMKKVSEYAPSTQKNFMATFTSVLSLFPSPVYKKLYKIYTAKLTEKKSAMMEARGDTMEKTDKEKANWVAWDDVLKTRNTLKDEVAAFVKKRDISAAQYEKLLAYLLLSIYTYLPPRRNLDYQQMAVVKKWSDKMPTDKNYLDLTGKKFVFNRFKTVKSSGVQTADIPEELMTVIQTYLKQHPAVKAKASDIHFLVKQDGTPLTATNGITRILNKTFGKKVGSSMLRHSYLSQKYGPVLEEMRADSIAMAHDGPTQATYIRGAGELVPAGGAGDVLVM